MRVRHAVGALLLGAVVLAGCSDDNDSESSSGGSTEISQADCAEAATAMSQAATDIPLALSGTAESLRDSVDEFKAFADDGPSEIRDDLRTVADGYADFVDVLADADINPNSGQAPSGDDAAKIQAAATKLGETDFQAAANRVTAWFATECGSN